MINPKTNTVFYSLEEISSRFNCKIFGNKNIKINNIAPISRAKKGDITYLTNLKYRHLLQQTKASALIASQPVPEFNRPTLCTENPYLIFAKVLELFFSNNTSHTTRIAQDASIGKDVVIGDNSDINSGVVIGDNVIIGCGVCIHPGTIIGAHTIIGDYSIIYPNVVIYPHMIIGKRVFIHAGVVIGSDGFGYAQESDHLYKVPQVGKCIIENDVEIGANSTIDRGTIGDTIIGSGTKIDNLVQIAHNVVVGKNCIIVAQTAIAGSSTLGNGVALGGQSAVAGHVTIGDRVMLAAKSGITKDIPPNTIIGGIIGRPIKEWRKSEVLIRNLPKLQHEIHSLSNRIKEIEKKIKN